MTEADAIDRVDDPVTVADIAADLRDLGVGPEDVLVVHSSLSAIGWVAGGAQAVVDALQRVVTAGGALAMPTHTGQYSNPEHWSNPPVPDDWPEQIRAAMPPFRPAVTPTRGVGAVPECFRTYPDAHRSRHPEASFAAWGADAEAIVANHSYEDYFGEESPLARVYDRNGLVLMLGTSYETNTSLHLAEHRADVVADRVSTVAPVRRNGERTTVEYESMETSTDDFPAVGAAFEETVGPVATGRIGDAEATLVDQAALVDFAVEWFEENRPSNSSART